MPNILSVVLIIAIVVLSIKIVLDAIATLKGGHLLALIVTVVLLAAAYWFWFR